MGMRNWSEQGYGYTLFNDNNFQCIIDFWVSHGDYDREELSKCETEYDLDEVCSDQASHAVASIIQSETNIPYIFGFDRSEYSKQHIGIGPVYPWNVEAGDLISQKHVHTILKEYAHELGITENPDYFECEYFG